MTHAAKFYPKTRFLQFTRFNYDYFQSTIATQDITAELQNLLNQQQQYTQNNKIIYSNLGFSTVNHIDMTQPSESYIPNYLSPIISLIIEQEPHPYLGLKVSLRILDRSNFSLFFAISTYRSFLFPKPLFSSFFSTDGQINLISIYF